MCRKHGFTLIELLVVIAIIAILAAILFPVFARARSKAMQNTCLSNMKQLGLSANMYLVDYDNTVFPIYYAAPPSRPAGYLSWYWSTLLSPYVKNDQIFICPSDTAPRAPDANYGGACCGTYAPGTPPKCSYYMNGISGSNFANCSGANVGFCCTPIMEALEDAARTILFYDAQNSGGAWALQQYQAYHLDMALPGQTAPVENSATTSVADVHFGGYNAAYMDGHAKWLKWGWETEPDYKAWVLRWNSNAACP